MPANPASPKKKILKRGSASSGSSNNTTTAEAGARSNDADSIQQSPKPRIDIKSVSFMDADNTSNTSPLVSPTESNGNRAELVTSPTESSAPKHRKRPSFKRNLSSLWKLLDPPELSHNTGALHNLAAQQEGHRSQQGASISDVDKETSLLATITDSQYKQRWDK